MKNLRLINADSYLSPLENLCLNKDLRTGVRVGVVSITFQPRIGSGQEPIASIHVMACSAPQIFSRDEIGR